MRLIYIFAFVLLYGSFGQSKNLRKSPLTAPIRVRLLRAQRAIEMDGFDLRFDGDSLSTSVLPIHSTVEISRLRSEWFIRKNHRVWRAHGQSLVVSGEMLEFEKNLQPPATYVLEARSNASFDVVADLRRKVYLEGVLPSEMPITWPVAALEAQAVASISYARAQALRHEQSGFDVDSSINSQVFNWSSYTRALTRERRKLAHVLAITRGQILINKRGQPYLAYFDSDCGGVTELAQNVWARPGDPTGSKKIVHHFSKKGIVYDQYCLLNPHNRWHYFVTWRQIQRAVRGEFHNFRGEVRNVKVVSRSPSGRAYQVEVVAVNGRQLLMLSQIFRQLIGYGRIRSTLFKIKHFRNGLEFDGRGFGHGVGMCQHGARFMALNGATYQQILSRYYPEARLINSRVHSAPISVIASSE